MFNSVDPFKFLLWLLHLRFPKPFSTYQLPASTGSISDEGSLFKRFFEKSVDSDMVLSYASKTTDHKRAIN
jgi:hypothetical protein